jgi:hypothetical protein
MTLAPLEPDAFMVWAFQNEDVIRQAWESPLTLDDVHFELSRGDADCSLHDLRKRYIRMAARVRRNQRLGRDPWEGI